MCGTVLTGLPLAAPLLPWSAACATVDLAHIFFGFALTLLLSAHLTLVALVTLSRATQQEQTFARRSSCVHAMLALAVCGAMFVAAISRN